MGFVKTININFTDNLPTCPITKSLWSYLKLLLICLLELGFRFDQSLPRGQPVGKSPYYRSFDRSANWRVKDSIKSISNESVQLDITFHAIASQLSGRCDVISRTWTEQVSHGTGVWRSSFLSSFMGSLYRVRNKIIYVLLWQTVYALTRVLFWCLFPSLLRNSGNNHQNNPLVSA